METKSGIDFLNALAERPEVILAFVAMIATTAMMLISSITMAAIRKSPLTEYERTLTRILRDEKIVKNFNNDPESLTASLAAALAAIPKPEPKPLSKGIFTKISEDITWDVSGLIGILVTAVILIMIVSSKTSDIPDTVFAGWTTILGYYFGKAAGKHN